MQKKDERKFQEYEIDINKIKPKNTKKSDKYSKAIYKYLKNNPHYRRVWFDKATYGDTLDRKVKKEFDVENMNLRNLFFGLPDAGTSNCITGKCINSLISGAKDTQETFCYIGFIESEFVEVTKEFFEKYIEVGRCIYGHDSYLADADDRYTYIDETHRKCNWCGKEQHQETETYVREHKKWVED